MLQNYKEVSGKKPCYSCKGKLKQYHSELINSSDLIIDELKNNFKLRNDIGVVQLDFGSGEFLSQLTSPDGLCIKFLKVNPARISMFEKYPENWKELITQNENENE